MILILKCYECSTLHEIEINQEPIEFICSCKYTRVKLGVKNE